MLKKHKYGIPVFMTALSIFNSCFAVNNIEDIKPNGCKGVSLADAYSDINGSNFNINIGFILEQMRLTNTDFGYISNTQTGVYNSLTQDVSMLRPSFGLSWGITAGAGYYFEHDNWYGDIKFDWLSSKGSRNICAENYQIVPTKIWKKQLLLGQSTATQSNVDFFYSNGVKSNFKINYFEGEIGLNRATYVSKKLSVEPFFGIKTAFIYYANKTEFFNDTTLYNSLSYKVSGEKKCDFYGVGPMFGVNSKWALFEGCSLFCDNNVGLLFGENDNHNNLFVDNVIQTSSKQESHVAAPVIRIKIGFQHDKPIFDNTQNLTFRVALDTSHYWNQYQHTDVFNETQNPTFHSVDTGTLSLIGLFADFGWDF